MVGLRFACPTLRTVGQQASIGARALLIYYKTPVGVLFFWGTCTRGSRERRQPRATLLEARWAIWGQIVA
jgi:hypothetical protein